MDPVIENLEIIVGTYDQFLIGYRVSGSSEKGHELTQVFADHSHHGSIRAISATDKFLASGSTDEMINVFNLKTRKQLGSLMEYNGTVTALQFYKNTHLFSGTEDGKFCMWSTKTWECLRTLTGHKAGITSLAIHPSGKLALTVSVDKKLITWNLIKGRKAFITNIGAVADTVLWSVDGSMYAVVMNNKVDIYSVASAGVINSIDFGREIKAICFIDNEHIALGGEGENVEIHRADRRAVQCVFAAHTNRVKGLQCVKAVDGSSTSWLVSASSDGTIKIWRLSTEKLSRKPRLVAQVRTGARINCLSTSVRSIRDQCKLEPLAVKEEPLEVEVKQDPDVSGEKLPSMPQDSAEVVTMRGRPRFRKRKLATAGWTETKTGDVSLETNQVSPKKVKNVGFTDGEEIIIENKLPNKKVNKKEREVIVDKNNKRLIVDDTSREVKGKRRRKGDL